MADANNNTILMNENEYKSIALKFQSLDLALRGLNHMLDEEGKIDHYDIEAVKRINSELYGEFMELKIDQISITKEPSHA